MPTRADQLTQGQTIAVPYTGTPETITSPPRISNGYVTVHTDWTGPESAYLWTCDEPITLDVPVCDDACERERAAAETCRHTT